MLDELGSEKSRPVESTQSEAHGEFGVTCRLTLYRTKRVRIKVNARGAISPGDQILVNRRVSRNEGTSIKTEVL